VIWDNVSHALLALNTTLAYLYNTFSSLRPPLLVQMVLCSPYLIFHQTDWSFELLIITEWLGEPPTLNIPENLVVVREEFNCRPKSLSHTKVSNDFLAWRLCNWKTPDIKMLLRLGAKNGTPYWIKKQSTACWFTKSL